LTFVGEARRARPANFESDASPPSCAGSKANDDAKPIDNVILVNGALYGMTTEGVAKNQGTIFKISLD
jgi:uncharacterized repeat protein (TIGR03803 family)